MDLLELVVKLVFDNSEYKKGLKNTEEQANKLSNKLSNSFGKIAALTAKAVAAATTAVATGMGVMIKQSVSAYGQYEQLVGGINKLFGKSSDKLKQYAESAYKSSGMSANQYIQNVTGFSAALINSLNGDTDKAVDLADKAMRDISDNANTYGKYTVEEIANVYQALAKGNYQTLDNLNLGFGGTKEGMQQLIEKAEQLDSTFRANRDENGKLTMSFNDMIEAIHIVQDAMNITDTTAQEASKTIEGSVGSAKAAWDNLVVALSATPKDNMPISKYVDNFVVSAEAAFNNLEPTIERALNGIAELIDRFAPEAINKISGIVNKILPSLLQSATTIVTSIIRTLSNQDNIKTILDVLQVVLQEVLKTIIEIAPDLITTVMSVITETTKWLINNLPSLLKPLIQSLPQILSSIINTVLEIANNLPELLDMLVQIIDPIADELIDLAPILVEATFQIIDKIIEFSTKPETLEKLFVMAAKIVVAVATGLLAATPKLIEGISKLGTICINNILNTDWGKLGNDIITNMTNALKNASDKLAVWWDGWATKMGEYAASGWNTIVETFSGIGSWFGDRWTDIKNAFSNVGTWFAETFSNAWTKIKEVFAPVGETFNTIGNSILDGVKSIVNGLISGINRIISEPFNGLNNALKGIKSIDILGSKPFEWINEIAVPVIPQLAKGGVLRKGQMAFLEGQGDEAVIPLSQNTEWIDKVADRLKGNAGNTYNINVNVERIDNANENDIENLAERLMEIITLQTERRGLSLA